MNINNKNNKIILGIFDIVASYIDDYEKFIIELKQMYDNTQKYSITESDNTQKFSITESDNTQKCSITESDNKFWEELKKICDDYLHKYQDKDWYCIVYKSLNDKQQLLSIKTTIINHRSTADKIKKQHRFIKVGDGLFDIVPTTINNYIDFIKMIKYTREDLWFKAPEAEVYSWRKLCDICDKYLNEYHDTEWEIKSRDLMMDKI